ncbi:SPOSA6832_03052, partial [Sporobolomyces salmonicolor]
MSAASSSASTSTNPAVDASFDYVDPVSPSLECPICRAPMIHPVMPPSCQHLFCHPCISRALDLSPTCPIDRAPLSLADLVPAPRVVSDLLGELRVKCSNARDGCDQVITRDAVERHVRDECRVEQARKRGGVKGKGGATDVGRGADAEDPREELERCELCEENSHASTCPSAPTPCPYCASALPRSSLSSHLRILCPLVPTPCPHTRHGCLYVGPRSSLALDHLDTECVYEPLQDYLRMQDERVWEVENENWALRRKMRGLEERLGNVERTLEGVKLGMGEYWRAGPTLSTSLASLSTRTHSLSASVSTLSHSHHTHLQTTHHLTDELAALRSVVHGMRLQMGGLLMELQRVSASAYGAAGQGRGGERGRMLRAMGGSASSDPEHEPEGGSSSSFSSDDEQLFPSSCASRFGAPSGVVGGGMGLRAGPVPFPMGMRFVGMGERLGGAGWEGHPLYGPGAYASSAGGGMGMGMGGRL